jgi:hypothetical protein
MPLIKGERTMSQRSNAFAERLERGATALANFAEALTEFEWQIRVPRDGRTIGAMLATQ